MPKSVDNAQDTGPYAERRKGVRLFLPFDEHERVRLAAAAYHLSMAEFCRQAALEKADTVTVKVVVQEDRETKKGGRK